MSRLPPRHAGLGGEAAGGMRWDGSCSSDAPKGGSMSTLRWWLMVSILALPWMGAVQTTAPLGMSGVAIAQDQAPAPAPKGPDVNVTVDRGGGEKTTEKTVVWIANPVVLAIAGGAILLVILVVALAGRGGGTTVVKD